MAIVPKTTATGTNDGTKQVSVNAWNAGHAVDEAVPSAPASGLEVFAGVVAQARIPAVLGPTGVAMPMGMHLGLGRRILMHRWPANATTVGVAAQSAGIGLSVAPTTTGATGTLRIISNSSAVTRCARVGLVSAATAGSIAPYYFSNAGGFFIGNGADLGGFMLVWRFAPSDAATVSGARMFIGMQGTTNVPTNGEPSTLTSSIGIAQLSTSSNLHIVYGGVAAQTPIDLGANFPAGGLSADLYDLILYAPPNSNNTVYYQVERRTSSSTPAFVASGTLTGTAGTALPSSAVSLTPRAWRCNNATALAVGLDLSVLYVEDASL